MGVIFSEGREKLNHLGGAHLPLVQVRVVVLVACHQTGFVVVQPIGQFSGVALG